LIRAISVDDYGRIEFDDVQGFDAILVDSGNGHGGTGRVHDWNISRRIYERCRLPFILAGGLNPNNVVDAIRAVRPYAVDVSTGVESFPGKKDRVMIASFVRNAKVVSER
ncbi:MAG: phosphoribosylanthranilate isomerase, partial [Candidatus Bathyarchaeia archaeon]